MKGPETAPALVPNNNLFGDLDFVGPTAKLSGDAVIAVLVVTGNISLSDGASSDYAGSIRALREYRSTWPTYFRMNRARLATRKNGGMQFERCYISNDSVIELTGSAKFRAKERFFLDNSRMNLSDATEFWVDDYGPDSNTTLSMTNSSLCTPAAALCLSPFN